jgi:hypothetical protein
VGQTVELTGTSLTLVDSVDFNGTDASNFWLGADDSHLEVSVPGGATAGFVTVHDADGHTAHTPASFTLTPGISTIAPGSGTADSTVVITGTDLTGATAVTFNGTAATYTVDSATQITATVPAGATSGKIVVTAPTGSDTSAENFLVPAAIASFDPVTGSGGDTITIHGAGFTNVSDVSFNAVPASFTVVDGATVTATVPTAASAGKITVTTDAGTATSGADFRVVPVVDSVSPSTGLAGSVVTISGRNLGAVTGIDFAGVPAVFGMTSATQITATVPDNAATGPLTLHTLASATGVTGPTFTVLPSLLGFTPVDAAPGTTITLTGSGLANVLTVTFGGGAETAPGTTAPNSLTVGVPAAATTGQLTVSDGTNHSTSDDVFTVD